jgi:hypothetical protein
MLSSPQFSPALAVIAQNPQPAFARNPRPAPTAPTAPVNASLAAGAAREMPRPTIRLQAPDAPAGLAARLVLPAPEELGIRTAGVVPGTTGASAADWNQVRGRMAQLGVLSFRVDRLANGSYRATFFLPTGQAERTHLVEASAASEEAALAGALQQAESWVGLRK